MQTLVDLVMSSTLIAQSTDILGHVFILNWSVFASSPTNDIICIIFTICISLLALFHTFFLLLTVLTKFVCVFYSRFQELLQDDKVIRTMWIFVFIASTMLVLVEFLFIHDIQTMNTCFGDPGWVTAKKVTCGCSGHQKHNSPMAHFQTHSATPC